MNKYILLNFRNAKLFRKFDKNQNNLSTKDKLFSPNGKNDARDRNYFPSFIEPITVYQISNMLHVLFNERPVPTLREDSTIYKIINHYFKMANNSYIKIDTPKYKIYGKMDYYSETTQTKKTVWNAWNKNVSINWKILEEYIGDKLMFSNLIEKLNNLLNIDCKSIPFIKVRDIIRNQLDSNKLKELYDFICDNLKGRNGLTYFFGIDSLGNLKKAEDSKIIDNVERSGRTINSGIETVIKLDGQIIVPVNDDDISKLENYSKGFANILDGGLVWIDSIKYEDDLNINGFTLVSEISTEKAKPYNSNK